jgi:NADH dehydrogenase
MATQKKRIVILGAGFGGLFAAVEFERLARLLPGVEVTLVDSNNYHLFVPLLYHVATGGIEPGNICFPVRSILKNGGAAPPVVFRECQVQSLDLEKKRVITDRAELDYDYLIFALGSTTNYYGIPGLEQNIVPLKTIADGVAMHNRILESFEAALFETESQKQRELLTFVIVGGGATGVELACTMALFVFKTLERDFPTVASQARVVLVEAGDGLLHGMRSELGQLTLKRLKRYRVEVILNCRVASATATGIQTKDGQLIPSRNVIWVGGVKPDPLAQAIPAEKARDGRIIVDPNLEVPSLPGVYIIGDCAYALQPGTSIAYPQTAQTAVRMGTYAAGNIARVMMGYPACPFDYKYKGDLVFLGRNYAVGEFLGRVISGFPAFYMYQGYHLVTLTGFRNKLITVIDWAYDYFYRQSTVKLR